MRSPASQTRLALVVVAVVANLLAVAIVLLRPAALAGSAADLLVAVLIVAGTGILAVAATASDREQAPAPSDPSTLATDASRIARDLRRFLRQHDTTEFLVFDDPEAQGWGTTAESRTRMLGEYDARLAREVEQVFARLEGRAYSRDGWRYARPRNSSEIAYIAEHLERAAEELRLGR